MECNTGVDCNDCSGCETNLGDLGSIWILPATVTIDQLNDSTVDELYYSFNSETNYPDEVRIEIARQLTLRGL